MGLTPADLAAVPPSRKPVPTFAEYVPVLSAAVSAGTRRAYGSYWNRVTEQWGSRRLDEPTPSEIRQLMAYVKTHVVARRNACGGRSAQEHLVAALRCLYRRAVDDGLITEADNPARKVAKPRRLPTTRRALPDTRLAEINEINATTGDDPELDTLLLRLHTETAAAAEGLLDLACILAVKLPGTRVAFRDGMLRASKVEIIARAVTMLDPGEARAAGALVLGRAGRLTPGGLRAAIARAVMEVAPGKARKRREQAARDARVQRWGEDSGNAALTGR